MRSTVLVTGAAGFIGSHLAERLLQNGHEVIGLDDFSDDAYSPAIKWENVKSVQAAGDFRLERGDIRDSTMLARVLSENRVDAVMHLAARDGVTPSLKQPLLYQDINIGGTINLLEACRRFKVRQVVFASSSSVYGVNGRVPFSEETRANRPISPYAASKAAAELFCRTYSYLYDLGVVVLRLFTVYGPRQRPDMAISRFVQMVDKGEEVTLFGNGSTARDFTFIDDIAAGFEAALTCRGEPFQIFNLGAGRTVHLDYLLRLIEEAIGKRARVTHLSPLPGEVPITVADISKARALLGWQPRTCIEEGIDLFVKWYLRQQEFAGESSRIDQHVSHA